MSVSVKVDGLFLLTVAGIAGGAWLWMNREQAAEAVQKVADTVSTKLNPASDENIVYEGVNKAGAALTGDENFTAGGAIYDALNPYDGIEYETDELGNPTEAAKAYNAVEEGYQRIHQGGIVDRVGEYLGNIGNWDLFGESEVFAAGGGVFNGSGASGRW